MKTEEESTCEGACTEHIGQVKHVEVEGWGIFDYCNNAIVEDKRRGFTLTVLEGCQIGLHDIIPVMGFDNVVIGEECRQCGIKIN